jgi:hypothetical protein
VGQRFEDDGRPQRGQQRVVAQTTQDGHGREPEVVTRLDIILGVADHERAARIEERVGLDAHGLGAPTGGVRLVAGHDGAEMVGDPEGGDLIVQIGSDAAEGDEHEPIRARQSPEGGFDLRQQGIVPQQRGALDAVETARQVLADRRGRRRAFEDRPFRQALPLEGPVVLLGQRLVAQPPHLVAIQAIEPPGRVDDSAIEVEVDGGRRRADSASPHHSPAPPGNPCAGSS